MKYEFKTGDKIRVVDASGCSYISLGDVFVCNKDLSTDCRETDIYFNRTDGTQDNYSVFRFEKVIEGKAGRKKKEQPIVEHIVLKDDCKNFMGLFNNYQSAATQTPSVGQSYSIYKLIKVASIKTDAVVKITKVGGKRK